MIAVFFLKMLSDAAVYYLFAAPVAAYFGSNDLMLCMVLQCLVYTVSRMPKSKLLRIIFLIPIAGCYLLQNTLAGYIALSPVTLYILWLTVTNRPGPSLSDERQHLEDFWKPMCLSVILALCCKQFAVFVTFALTALFSSVMLLRTLRHGSQVYNQPKFHCINFLTVATVPAAACLLGSGAVLRGVKAIFSPIYKHVLTPLLLLIVWIPMMLLQWILDLFIPDAVQEKDPPPELGEGFAEIQEVIADYSWIQAILMCILVMVGICIVLFLLRKLKPGTLSSGFQEVYRSDFQAIEQQGHVSEQRSSAVRNIRRYYRRFLKLCEKKGLRRKESSTSAEIDKHAKQLAGISEGSSQIRSLYIRARYGGYATSEDVSQMRKLLTATKKDAENGR